MSFNSFFGEMPFRAQLIGWGILIGPIIVLVLLALLLLRPKPIAPDLVFGCYTAEEAPWLKVEASKISIGEKEGLTLAYLAEPAKEGYRLSVSPALGLAPVGEGKYAFKPEHGIGYFWPLLSKSSDDPKALRDPSDFGGRFRVIAQDGVAVIYTKSSDRRSCQ